MFRQPRFLLPVLFVIVALFAFSSAYAEENGDEGKVLHEAIMQEHDKAKQKEGEVKRLERKATTLERRIGDIETRIARYEREIEAGENVLKEIRKHEELARKEHFRLEARRDEIAKQLKKLLGALWPVHLSNVQAKFGGADSWAEIDRRYQWLSAIYGEARVRLAEARKVSDDLARNIERQRLLEGEATVQLERVNETKDKLLKDRLTMLASLRKTQDQHADAETELLGILGEIKKLNYRLNTQKTKRFDYYKHSLPWPLQGEIVKGFAPNDKPPSRGVSIASGVGEQVRSVFWGKVVHNDTLRGFGRVVVIYHGFDYYSLYAYLSESFVRNGQEVEKDEPIGATGYLPAAKSAGLYFELRFHQKPINPNIWLNGLN